MAATQLRYQGTTDAHRLLAMEFPIGSWAFMKVQFFCTTRPSKKLADKFLGPYEVIVQLGTHSVTLRLLDNLRAVHPVFHVSMLEPATPSTIPDRVQPRPSTRSATTTPGPDSKNSPSTTASRAPLAPEPSLNGTSHTAC